LITLFAIGVLLATPFRPIFGIQNASQTSGEDRPFVLRVPVDEVSITFHVSDPRGVSVNGLNHDEFRLFDDGKLQQSILEFNEYRNLPIRAGFLIDTSGSMLDDLDREQSIANLYATRLLRKGIDQAFVMGFSTGVDVTQNWTDNPAEIAAGLQDIPTTMTSRHGSGTAIFDSLYRTCRDRWTTDRVVTSGNFILLFTDGIDDASHARLNDVIDMCQRTRTAIYVFTNQWNLRGKSAGQKALRDLTAQSGGRLFLNPSANQIERDVSIMDSDQRSQYRLVYKPSNFHPNGAFHSIRLHCSRRNASILTRSGYYSAQR
jgi:VWFA-related protein